MSTFSYEIAGKTSKLEQNDSAFVCPTAKTASISIEGSTPKNTKLTFTEGQYVAPAVVQSPAPSPSPVQSPAPEPEVESDGDAQDEPEEEVED